MPTYRITSPDGKAFDVTAPEGATQDQVLEYAKSQWAKGASAEKPKPQVDDPGFGQSMLIGAGRTFDRVGKGMQQLYYGATGNQKKQAELDAEAAEDTRLYAPLQKARPWATGIGEALPSMVLPAGGAATMLGNAGRMAVAGALPGVLEHGTAGERLQRGTVGALAGAAAPIVGAGAKTAWSVAEPLFAKGREAIAGRTMNRVVGDAAPDVIRRLRGATELVPGSKPTAGQVAGSGGIAALERAAAAANPEAYTQRAMEQSAARVGALRGIAGDDAAIAAAEAARASTTKPMYDQAKGAVYAVDSKLGNLLDRPLVKKAMGRAKDIAENDGRAFEFKTTSASPFSGVGGPSAVTTRQITGQGLQDLKMALDAMLKDPASGIAGKEIEQAQKLRGQILDWMETANPVFKQARTTYAAMSQPVNQMKVGGALLDKLQPALADYGAVASDTGATFARQLRNADQMVRTATGFKGAKGLEDVMGPKMATIDAIAQDLARKSNAQNLGRGVGSDTFQKLSMQNVAQQSGMPGLVGGLLGNTPGIARATSWAYRETDEKLQTLLADAMLNPKLAADLMAKADKKWLAQHPIKRRLLEQSAVRAGGLLGMSSAGALAQPVE